MVKRLVKKVSTTKTVKKNKVTHAGTVKTAKPAKKAVLKPAAKTVKKKPASSKVTKAAPKSSQKTSASILKKTVQRKTVEKEIAKKVESKNKIVKKAPQIPTLKIPSEEHMKPKQQDQEHVEEYMNTKQESHFREVLLDWKKQLLGEMERTVHHMQDEAANFPDPNDRATQEEEFSLELRARDRERKLIKKIDEALVRLDNHDYGYCEACGVEIGVQRLDARPTATLCIDCKTIDEIKEKHFS